MFCSNCGSKLADGSRFCSVCGAKLVEFEAPAEGFGSKGTDANERPAYHESKVSFDWSNVTDEPRKREVPEIRSPWEGSEYGNESFIDATPSQDHSRTLSFIEILKQEREEKLQAAEKEAESVTEREETPSDFTPFEETPAFYIPPMYNDITSSSEAPLEELKFDEPTYEEPLFEEPKYEEPVEFDAPVFKKVDEPTAELEPIKDEDIEKAAEPVIEPFEGIEDLYLDDGALSGEEYTVEIPMEDIAAAETPAVEPVAPVVEEAPVVEPVAPVVEEVPAVEPVAPVVEEQPEPAVAAYYDADKDIAASDPDKLSAELDAILNAARSNIQRTSTVEDSYLGMETAEPAVEEAPVVEPAAPAVEPVAEPAVEAPVIETAAEQFADAEPETEDVISLDELMAESDTTVETKGMTIAAPADDESEIESLKRRLAELMGTPEEPEEIPKKEEKSEPEDIFGTETVAAPAPEEGLAAAVTAPEPEKTEDSDVLSIDDLEKDLFGEVTQQEVEAEQTKKIDKFYTLYKKNEEFQRLLDEEYNKLKADDEAAEAEVEFPAVEKEDLEPIAKEEVAEVIEPVAAVVEETPVVEEKVEPAVVEPVAAVEEVVPVVSEVVQPTEIKEIISDDTSELPAVEKKAEKSKKDIKAEKKAAKKANKYDDDEEEGGGSALTVIAVIIAFLLVILLAVILILNFAPDSSIAIKIDSIIENIASYVSVVDVVKGKALL